tara:strand:+ start:145 stop:552 length:408 start_codon:yes stop_codon:yes gene_type:complete
MYDGTLGHVIGLTNLLHTKAQAVEQYDEKVSKVALIRQIHLVHIYVAKLIGTRNQPVLERRQYVLWPFPRGDQALLRQDPLSESRRLLEPGQQPLDGAPVCRRIPIEVVPPELNGRSEELIPGKFLGDVFALDTP